MIRLIFRFLYFLNKIFLPKYSGNQDFSPQGIQKAIIAYKYWVCVNSLEKSKVKRSGDKGAK